MESDLKTPSWAIALETSGLVGGIALGRDDQVLDTRPLDASQRHAAGLLPSLDEMCKAQSIAPADIECVYISIGPGSFTGLRIAATVARMLAFAQDAHIATVPSLDVIAQNAREAEAQPSRVIAIRDAKRRHVYAGVFELKGGVYQSVTEAAERDPAELFSEEDGSTAIVGEGVAAHRAAVEESGLQVLPEDLWAPRPEVVFELGRAKAIQREFVEPRNLVPLYVRKPEPEEKWEAKHGRTCQ